MTETVQRAIAVVGVGAILPDAPTAPAFWQNVKNKRYSISETPPHRWSIADYYDPDPSAPDKTYSKIGGWVQGLSVRLEKVPHSAQGGGGDGRKTAMGCHYCRRSAGRLRLSRAAA
jgi:hypothetical protein